VLPSVAAGVMVKQIQEVQDASADDDFRCPSITAKRCDGWTPLFLSRVCQRAEDHQLHCTIAKK
jgi:hypothetical protein